MFMNVCLCVVELNGELAKAGRALSHTNNDKVRETQIRITHSKLLRLSAKEKLNSKEGSTKTSATGVASVAALLRQTMGVCFE